VYFEIENRTWRNIFFTNVLIKKQLYRQEVPERRSKDYTNKKISGGNLELPGEFPPGCMSRRNTGQRLLAESIHQ